MESLQLTIESRGKHFIEYKNLTLVNSERSGGEILATRNKFRSSIEKHSIDPSAKAAANKLSEAK